MRFDKKIELVVEGQAEFNPETGNYDDGKEKVVEAWANVSDTTEEQMSFLYGGLKRGAYTVRLQGHNAPWFDFIRMNGRSYQIDKKRVLRRFMTFQVSEKL